MRDWMVHGYAATWNEPFVPAARGQRVVLLPDTLAYTAAVPLLCWLFAGVGGAHAGTRDGSLHLQEDGHGLRCCFTPRASRGAVGLLRAIGSARCNGLSLGLIDMRGHPEQLRGEQVTVIDSALVTNITVVISPLCDSARCWPAAARPDNAAPEIRRLMDCWSAPRPIARGSPAGRAST